jgi:hypothetical protein
LTPCDDGRPRAACMTSSRFFASPRTRGMPSCCCSHAPTRARMPSCPSRRAALARQRFGRAGVQAGACRSLLVRFWPTAGKQGAGGCRRSHDKVTLLSDHAG